MTMSEPPPNGETDEPDIFGLVDVMSLIAPQGVARGTTPLRGGLATAMDVVEVDLESGAQVAFVLRRFVHPSFTSEDAVREAATLEALRPMPVPAPELLWLDGDGRVFARPALAMTHLPGQSALSLLATDPDVVRDRLLDAITTVSWVPVVTAEHLPKVLAGDQLATWFEVGSAAFSGDGLAPPDLQRRLTERLDEAVGDDPRVPVVMHGDLHAGNLLVDDGQLSGLVDWDRAAIGDPRVDVAYAAVSLALAGGVAMGRELLDVDLERGGDHSDLDAFILLALCRALPDPAAWLPAWAAHGIDVTADQVRERWQEILRDWT